MPRIAEKVQRFEGETLFYVVVSRVECGDDDAEQFVRHSNITASPPSLVVTKTDLRLRSIEIR